MIKAFDFLNFRVLPHDNQPLNKLIIYVLSIFYVFFNYNDGVNYILMHYFVNYY